MHYLEVKLSRHSLELESEAASHYNFFPTGRIEHEIGRSFRQKGP